MLKQIKYFLQAVSMAYAHTDLATHTSFMLLSILFLLDLYIVIDLIIVDLSTAFDTINHRKLICTFLSNLVSGIWYLLLHGSKPLLEYIQIVVNNVYFTVQAKK